MSDAKAELQELRLDEIKRQGECIIQLTEEVTQLRIDVARLEIKAGIYGFISGLPASIATLLYTLLKGGK